MGCISRINELDLFVSLPHQLVGVVAITEISDAITAVVEKVANEDEDEDMEEGSETSLPNWPNYSILVNGFVVELLLFKVPKINKREYLN